MKHILAATFAGLLVFGLPPLSPQTTSNEARSGSSILEASTAEAGAKRRKVRRAARRTTRRVIRRHQYYRSLPRGCIRAAIRGTWYWRCGGVYYSEVIDNGATVYIIVNP